jgi:hypothetical protein
MTFNSIVKTLPSYTLRTSKIFEENKICLKILQHTPEINKKYKDKYNYFYYYLYKLFGKDLAIKLMINYIIELFINIPQNYYYKLYTNVCYKLYENKFMLVKTPFNINKNNDINYINEFQNKFSLYQISKIYKHKEYKPSQKNFTELTYITLSSCNLLVTLYNNKTNIEKIHFSSKSHTYTILFEDEVFLNNQDILINILLNKICLCSDCLNIRKNKIAMKLEKNKYKDFHNGKNFWLDPLQHKYI